MGTRYKLIVYDVVANCNRMKDSTFIMKNTWYMQTCEEHLFHSRVFVEQLRNDRKIQQRLE
uniref:Helitron helicase n=1 Tax=Heterorhabditis bacteriophora TaxID=37862 RepID=A0A1I7WRY6_HETBA